MTDNDMDNTGRRSSGIGSGGEEFDMGMGRFGSKDRDANSIGSSGASAGGSRPGGFSGTSMRSGASGTDNFRSGRTHLTEGMDEIASHEIERNVRRSDSDFNARREDRNSSDNYNQRSGSRGRDNNQSDNMSRGRGGQGQGRDSDAYL